MITPNQAPITINYPDPEINFESGLGKKLINNFTNAMNEIATESIEQKIKDFQEKRAKELMKMIEKDIELG